jgi:hypothetical protein
VTDYSEPNIKSKGNLLPRKAVLPIPVKTTVISNKIQVLETNVPLKSVPSPAVPIASIPFREKTKTKPKAEFKTVNDGTAFVLTVMMPDEVRSSPTHSPPLRAANEPSSSSQTRQT